MGKHILSLEITEVTNQAILYLYDTSTYADNLAVTCPQLLITAPGFQYSALITPEPGFKLSLTACDLDLQTSNCDSVQDNLPDGVYAIEYSVSPNEYVKAIYNHLRMTKILNLIQQLYCDLDICVPTSSEAVSKKLDEINRIEDYLKAAKAKVEVGHDAKKGMELYNYAKKLIDKLTCKNC